MGIRIHKKLGYGLTDVQHEGGRITDPRINTSSHLLEPPDEVGPEYLMYLEGLKGAEEEGSDEHFDILLEIKMVTEAIRREKRVPWPITWSGEYGRPDVLLVQPMAQTDWSRYDDPIDFAEESALHNPIEPRVVPVSSGIYPHKGLYMDSRNGRRLDSTVKCHIDRLLKAEEDKPEYRNAANGLARVSGFDDADHARAHVAPLIPGDIRRVASWVRLFNEEDTWLQLRPLLYVYWS